MGSCQAYMSYLVLMALTSALPVAAQNAAPVSAPALDTAARQQIVKEFARAMRDHYVFPDRADQVAARVTAALSSGQYDSAKTAGELAGRLSADASAITHDKHLDVFSMQEPQGERPPHEMPTAEGGVARADTLASGVGYIEVVSFPPLSISKQVIDTVMTALSGSRALIIDVRRNGGGDPESVAYLVSFLITPGRPINDIISRVEKTNDTTRQSFRSVRTPVSFLNVPVYVLTSNATFSGGEEFAYDVQAMKRGTLIGETTGGGANPVGPVDIGHDVVAMIPVGRAENPITKSNWEGVGVRPEMPVAADFALSAALTRAGAKPSPDIAAASKKRLFSPRTTPLPGSDAKVRQFFDAISDSKTIEDIVTPEFASVIQPQLSQRRAELASLGKLLLVDFWRPGELRSDEYKLTFANGQRKTRVFIDPDGKIAVILPLAPLTPSE